jgi:uncharacterized protein YcbK (DUF882 family)
VSDPESRSPLSRRRFVAGSAAAGCAMVTATGRSALAALPARQLSFYNTHTDETVTTVYWDGGRLLRDGLAEIDYILRDHRTNEVHGIDPNLLDLLHRLRTSMAYDGPIHVISGYRSPETNAMLAAQGNGVAKNSYHVRGMAIDLRLPGRLLDEVRRAALELARGGVGYYPKSDFVHVDTGPVRAW